jgi:hypothetical protein
MREQEAKEEARRKAETETRAETIARTHEEQEKIVRDVYPDFDDALKLAKELATDLEAIEDPVKQKWARKLMKDFHNAALNADKLGEDDLTAAELAYEIGRLHPRYGKSRQAEAINDGTLNAKPEISPNNGTGGQKHTPEQMKRLEANTQRRASSASIPGSGGRRTVSPEDVTASDFIAMSPEKRAAFKEKYPEQMARLRG